MQFQVSAIAMNNRTLKRRITIIALIVGVICIAGYLVVRSIPQIVTTSKLDVTVKFVVMDGANKTPLSGARIKIASGSDKCQFELVTDRNGRAELLFMQRLECTAEFHSGQHELSLCCRTAIT
jgi:hypothetical protein